MSDGLTKIALDESRIGLREEQGALATDHASASVAPNLTQGDSLRKDKPRLLEALGRLDLPLRRPDGTRPWDSASACLPEVWSKDGEAMSYDLGEIALEVSRG